MKKLLLVLTTALTGLFAGYAQDYEPDNTPIDESLFVSQARVNDELNKDEGPLKWFFCAQAGYALSFGDDSWHVIDDFNNAKGTAVSLSFGREFTPVFGGRIKARYLDLFNRVNLEVMDAYKDVYPGLFPRDGFYGYRCFAMQAEFMLNVANLFHRSSDWFNAYLLLGGGFNAAFDYDENVKNWVDTYEGVNFFVDTRWRVMPAGVVGGMLDFKVCPELSLNIEALATFTGDMLEGVKYEEPYDVYVTLSLGATFHF